MRINEIKNTFFNTKLNCYCIDIWRTSNQYEEGKTIAHVYRDKVEFFSENAKEDERVLAAIDEAKTFFK